jgi:hypothetical protein
VLEIIASKLNDAGFVVHNQHGFHGDLIVRRGDAAGRPRGTAKPGAGEPGSWLVLRACYLV